MSGLNIRRYNMKTPLSDEALRMIYEKIRPLNPKTDPASVDWYWSDRMSLRNGNLGRYYWLTNRMMLPEDSRLMVLTQNDMLPTLMHELYHAYYRNLLTPPVYAIYAFRPWADHTIEPSARQEARRIELLLHLQGQDTGEQAGD